MANDRCTAIEMEVRQEASDEMRVQMEEAEKRYRALLAQDNTAAEVWNMSWPRTATALSLTLPCTSLSTSLSPLVDTTHT